MKILLAALNAKFLHSSLAIRSLLKYSEKYSEYIHFSEYTINHSEDFVLSEIYKQRPNIICFSCYIWNIEAILRISENTKKVLPDAKIIFGGPEVSYNSYELLKKYDFIDIIISGEGEETFFEICGHFIDNNKELNKILGITYRQNGEVIKNPPQIPLVLDDIPFAYDNLDGLSNRIIYYETQRGCPFNCQYCMSSVEKGVRFLSWNRVKSDLDFFLENKVPQVKFVDRTFNCNKNHAVSIWKYLMENDNGITNFHMEIKAELLDDEIIHMLYGAREGLFQFEIGVQSTNNETVNAIKRAGSFEKLSNIVNKVKEGKNIHLHLDLIAGLPKEDYNSFKNSFNDVYSLSPEQFQLGFLKILKGSGLEKDAEKYGIVYREKAPYEVLYTNKLSFYEVLKLKGIEEMVETYYNSGKALNTIRFAEKYFTSPFDFYEKLSEYYIKNDYDKQSHSKAELFFIFYKFAVDSFELSDKLPIVRDFLRLDMLVCDNLRTLPEWSCPINNNDTNRKIFDFFEKEENINKYIPHLKGFSPKQLSRMCHIEIFENDIMNISCEKSLSNDNEFTAILFDYNHKRKVVLGAKYYKIEL